MLEDRHCLVVALFNNVCLPAVILRITLHFRPVKAIDVVKSANLRGTSSTLKLNNWMLKRKCRSSNHFALLTNCSQSFLYHQGKSTFTLSYEVFRFVKTLCYTDAMKI